MRIPVLDFSPTEQWVIVQLCQQSCTALELIARYNGPKQSVYKALRSLEAKNIVIDGHTLSLSKIWTFDMVSLFSKSIYSVEPMWSLRDGEKMIYYFDDFNSCDNYFFQIYLTMPEHIDISEPLVFHSPHHWFFISRYETEKLFWDHQYQLGRQGYVAITGNTVLDKYIGHTLLSHPPTIHFSLSRSKLSQSVYYTTISDWIVEARATNDFNSAVQNWFDQNTTITEQNTQQLTAITSAPVRIKMTIQRNRAKAEKLRKTILRDFLV